MARLESSIILVAPPDQVFAFFADAFNLEELTPSWLRFHVLTRPPIAMGVGTRIHYRLRVRGVPLGWTSEITAWEPPVRFVDEQVRGPYRRWRHEHRFLAQDRGTLVEDTVEYEVPGGAIIDRLLVRPDLERIFRYRRSALASRFGSRS
jgi:ligand-binding SRPBCC domain-containing protein